MENERGVFHRLGERADLVERGGEGDKAVAGNAAVGWLEADDSAVRGGLADGAASVRTEGGDGGAVGDGGGGTTGGTAGDARRVVGVTGFSEGGIFGGRSHRELVLIHPTERDGPGGAEFFDNGGVVGGDVVFEKFRAASAGLAEDVHVVLDGDGDATERQGKVRDGGLGEGGLEIVREIGTSLGIAGGDFPGEFSENRGGGGGSGGELLAELGNGHVESGAGNFELRVGDDFRHADLALGLVGGVLEDCFRCQAGVGDIVTHPAENGGGVGGFIDPGDVELRERLHVAEDGFELRLEFCDLGLREFEAGEIRDVADIDGTVRHGRERLEIPGNFQVPSASSGKRRLINQKSIFINR